MDIWITSDTHFSHSNIIKHCNRPFSSAKEMDEALVENWNLMIKPKDIVYHLGDFCFRGGHDARFYTDKLNGKKILIKGNHDKLKNGYYESFSEIHDLFELKVNKQLIVMCHYAMRTWNKSHRDSLHCYGHSHNTLPSYHRSMDVGVDTNNYFPYNIDEIIDRLSNIDIGEIS